MDCIERENPLKRDGTSQAQRLLKAALPGYVSVDERGTDDLLYYASRYANLLRYYNLDNEAEGTWKEFLEQDISVVLSIIINTDLAEEEENFNINKTDIADRAEADVPEYSLEDDPADPSKKGLYWLFEQIYDNIIRFDRWLRGTGDALDFDEEIRRLIEPGLQNAVLTFASLAAGARDSLTGFNRSWSFNFLSEEWGIGTDIDPSSVTSDTDAFDNGGSIGSDVEKVAWLLRPNGSDEDSPIQSLYDEVYEISLRLVNVAGDYLERSVTEYPEHKPHIALLITFVLLMRYQQTEINKITARHLDFYYKDVLQLKKKAAVPDRVHVVFELARNLTERQVPVDTRILAGKDAEGNDLIYQLERELIVNPATVASLRTIFINKRENPDIDEEEGIANDDVNGIYAAKVANSADGAGAEIEREPASWPAFGEDQSTLSSDTRTMSAADIGFAFASPTLRLAGGKRYVDLRLTFFGDGQTFYDEFMTPFAADNDLNAGPEALEEILGNAFCIELSGEKAWLEPADLNVLIGRKESTDPIIITNMLGEFQDMEPYILIRAELDADAGAVVDFDSELLEGGFDTEWPVMRVRLRTETHGWVYQHLKNLKFDAVDLFVEVENVTGLVVQNDLGPVDPSKPFFPFGVAPVDGSSCYIGNAEAFSKKLVDLDLTIEWLDPPEDLSDHYATYLAADGNKVISANTSFTTQIKILDKFVWKDLADLGSSTTYKEFNLSRSVCEVSDATTCTNTTAKTRTVPANRVPLFKAYAESGSTVTSSASDPVVLSPPDDTSHDFYGDVPGIFSTIQFDRDPTLETIGRFDPNSRRGFLRLELNGPDFQHKNFKPFFTKAVIQTAIDGITNDLPTEPYQPQIKSVSLAYKAETRISFSQTASSDFYLLNETEQLFHVHPFGYAPILPVDNTVIDDQEYEIADGTLNTRYFLPHYPVTLDGTTYVSEGQLLIGLEKFDPPRQISLLFQLEEGTGDVDRTVPEVTWEYMSGNGWYEFEPDELVLDTTKGLVKSGIVRLTVPSVANDDNTVLPSDMHWLRAVVPYNAAAMPRIIQVAAQAATAVFEDEGNAASHLESPLAAEEVKGLENSDSKIKSVTQPYESFGGKPAEDDDAFYLRAGERLRHKNRAITIWDYERLILENFPSVYKVICLNHTSRVSQVAPGNVSIVLIPDLSGSSTVNLLEPRVSVGLMQDVKDFLEARMPPWARLFVNNPQYEKVKVKAYIKFHDGYDPGFYSGVAEEDIISFLSPWAYDEAADIAFGGSVSKSVIIDFLEEKEYVDYIKDFQMWHIVEGRQTAVAFSAEASTPRSILVSASGHTIEIIEEGS